MKTFKFKAKDKSGKLIKGKVEANNENHAAVLIRERGFVLISLSVGNRGNLVYFLDKFKKGLNQQTLLILLARFLLWLVLVFPLRRL